MSQRWSRRDVLFMGLVAGLTGCAETGSDPTGATRPRGSETPSAVQTRETQELRVGDLPAYAPSSHFPEGILSGDPRADSVVLWTRPSRELATRGLPVVAEIATDVGFREIAATASSLPDQARGDAVKFVVGGLQSNTPYCYRFKVGEVASPVGFTRTAPGPDDAIDRLTMGVFSCQRWTHGFYTAHADLAAQAPDVVVCLGDYVYNTGAADGVTVPGRDDPIQDAHTLDEFRAKYEHYRSDANLQAMHARVPMIAVPDNHDGAPLPGDEMYPGAHQAFFEKMPVREDPDDLMRTHRRFAWGTLVDLWMLDLHRWATPGERGSGDTLGDRDMMDESVSYLGDTQRQWLFDGLADSRAVWQVLGSTKQFSGLRARAGGPSEGLNGGTYLNLDQWDGYQAERLRVLDEVKRLGRTGVVAVTGDMHWFWAADVPRDLNDPGSPPIMVDFLCGGITSSNADERIQGGAGGPQTKALLDAFASANTYAKYFDADRHGYGLFTFTRDSARVEFRSPKSITTPTSETEVVARFSLDPQRPGIKLDDALGRDPATGRPA